MKPLLCQGIICLAFLFMIACQGNPSSASVNLAGSWIDALNRHDTMALASLYSDSAAIESPNWEGKKTGPAEIRSIYRRYFSSTPDLQQVMTHLVANDTCLVIEYQSWGTLRNPEKNTPDYMQGKKYTLQNCTRMSIRNGKIINQKTYFDQVSFLKQMGFFEEH